MADDDNVINEDALTPRELQNDIDDTLVNMWIHRSDNTISLAVADVRLQTERDQNWTTGLLSHYWWQDLSRTLITDAVRDLMAVAVQLGQVNHPQEAPPVVGNDNQASSQPVVNGPSPSQAVPERPGPAPPSEGLNSWEGVSSQNKRDKKITAQIVRTLDKNNKCPADFGPHWSSMKLALYSGQITRHDLSNMCTVVKEARLIGLPISDISRKRWRSLFELREKGWIRKVRKMLKRIQKKLQRKKFHGKWSYRGHRNHQSNYEAAQVVPAPPGVESSDPPAQIVGSDVQQYKTRKTTPWLAPPHISCLVDLRTDEDDTTFIPMPDNTYYWFPAELYNMKAVQRQYLSPAVIEYLRLTAAAQVRTWLPRHIYARVVSGVKRMEFTVKPSLQRECRNLYKESTGYKVEFSMVDIECALAFVQFQTSEPSVGAFIKAYLAKTGCEEVCAYAYRYNIQRNASAWPKEERKKAASVKSPRKRLTISSGLPRMASVYECSTADILGIEAGVIVLRSNRRDIAIEQVLAEQLAMAT